MMAMTDILEMSQRDAIGLSQCVRDWERIPVLKAQCLNRVEIGRIVEVEAVRRNDGLGGDCFVDLNQACTLREQVESKVGRDVGFLPPPRCVAVLKAEFELSR